jgi:hypothetical protein
MNRLTLTFISVLAVAVAALSFQPSSRAQAPSQSVQSVTIFQYRQVPADKRSEFIHRETTYWSKVAEKAVNDGKLTLWVLLEQVGGYDLPNAPNFLFVNTVSDVDALGDIFNVAALFPNVPMESMSTDGISTTTSQFFLRDGGNIVEAAGTVRDRDFKYLTISYHNSSDAALFVALERQVWAPFIKMAMDKKQTLQRGWTDASVLAPLGEHIKFNSVSADFFPSLQAALMHWQPGVVFPTDGLAKLDKLRLNRTSTSIYRIVHVVAAK